MSVTVGTIGSRSQRRSAPAAAASAPSLRSSAGSSSESAVAFLTVFLVLPLVVVFQQALVRGIGPYIGALTHPDAVAAIQLTLWVAAISVALNLVFRADRGLGDRQVRVSRQELPDHADRSAVLGQPGDLGSGVHSAVRRARFLRRLSSGPRHQDHLRAAGNRTWQRCW